MEESHTVMIDREVPHSITIEEAILSACLTDESGETVEKCISHRFGSDTFFKPSHQIFWKAISMVYAEKGYVDELIMVEFMKENFILDEVGGYGAVSKMSMLTDTGVLYRVDGWIEKLLGLESKRAILKMANTAISMVHRTEADIPELIAHVNGSIMNLSNPRGGSLKVAGDVVDDAYAQLEEAKNTGSGMLGLPTGLADIDRQTMGLKPGELTILAARPSVGKSALAFKAIQTNLFPRRLSEACSILLFTLEMDAKMVTRRLACMASRLSWKRYVDGVFNPEQEQRFRSAFDVVGKAPLWIEERSDISGPEIRSTARHVSKKDENLGLVVVDYLQLASSGDGKSKQSREQEVSAISKDMKAMGKEMNLPVLVLSQLNRDLETKGRKPRLSDLRESGSIEQDADVVILLSRTEDRNTIWCDVAKQREGSTGAFNLTFLENITLFENYAGDNTI